MIERQPEWNVNEDMNMAWMARTGFAASARSADLLIVSQDNQP
jgi:hypothetical protein